MVRRVRDDHGRLVDVGAGEDCTGYRLTSAGITTNIRATLLDRPAPVAVSVLDDLFDSIVGFEDVKELLLAALRTDRPVHVLLVGPPALAKSLFLWDIERVFGTRALWLLGSATSQAGMWDLVAEHQPDVLLLDEFEKIKGGDPAALLSLREGGRLVRAKVGRGLNLNLDCRVFAAANTTRGLTPEILSRFARRDLRPYNQAEFQEVVNSVLVNREGVGAAVAAEIAASLAGRTQDVRDAIRVARLSQQMDPNRSISPDLRPAQPRLRAKGRPRATGGRLPSRKDPSAPISKLQFQPPHHEVQQPLPTGKVQVPGQGPHVVKEGLPGGQLAPD